MAFFCAKQKSMINLKRMAMNYWPKAAEKGFL